MFSMFIDHINHESKIQIGGYDLKKYASSKIHWHSIASPMYWEMQFSGVRMGEHKFTPSVSRVMADTGTSLNMIPNHDFENIF
mmetsp:Transcript_3416/g.5782  ORF Transcript_3416/g.5782 Transcript_3416/m.5782 type:complete len:83 (-) Transcript_3416:594-842(-)